MNTLVRVHHAYTTDAGFYSSDHKFLTKVCYSIFYKNGNRYAIWKNNLFFLPASVCYGFHSNHGFSMGIDTSSAAWLPTAVSNATDIYWRMLAPHYNINPPVNGLRIMIVPTGGDWGGCTPMFRHQFFSSAEQWGFWDRIVSVASLGLNMSILPDIFYLSTKKTTQKVYSNMFHELSHVSHYTQVDSNYWHRYVCNIIANLGYGDGTHNTECIGVGEMWGFYSEYYLCRYYWDTIRNNAEVSKDSVRQPPHTDWFFPDSLRTLVDSIDGLDYKDIYDCLVVTDTTLCELKKEIKLRVNHAYYSRVNKSFENMCND